MRRRIKKKTAFTHSDVSCVNFTPVSVIQNAVKCTLRYQTLKCTAIVDIFRFQRIPKGVNL